MRRRLAALSASEQRLRSQGIASLIRNRLRADRPACVSVFAPMLGEPDLLELLEEPTTWVFPKTEAGQLTLWAVAHQGQLKEGPYGLREPDPAVCARILPDQVDWVLTPGLGFGWDGSRLGRGKGFYDRLIPEIKGGAFGVCFREQIEPSLPRDAWDRPVAELVCEEGWWRCGGADGLTNVPLS